ncbi:probable pectate lyase 4 isoform X1 [Triticum aestivum]|uniref:probable pectate lyase 4 isoform X1 n=1 Tax=Triticum aestivum TaxID=4565 RepID=UPI001D0211F6|nr:probable pectate lyase 4 isoform X1 [Triticum aestivum]
MGARASCFSRLYCCWISFPSPDHRPPRPPPTPAAAGAAYLPCPGMDAETGPGAVTTAAHRPPQPRTPYADADRTLRALAAAAEGFGRRAIGGLHGALYHVTSLQDDGHGTLREACRAKEPLWVVFEVSGDIHLHTYLRVSSHKTIDGRGQRVRLTGKGLQLKDCHHVIVCNLQFEAGRGHDVDGIQIKPGSTNIWIDRCSLADYDDGLIDITRQSTDITVSRCHFARHDKTMLIGADPKHVDDRCIRVTIHHCFFDGTRQRHPRLRFGKVHLYNNYTRDWGIYAVCAGVEAQIVSQCNIYEGGHKKTVFKLLTEKRRRPGGSGRRATRSCTGRCRAWSTARAPSASSGRRSTTTGGRWRRRRRRSRRSFSSALGGSLCPGLRTASAVNHGSSGSGFRPENCKPDRPLVRSSKIV